MAGPVQGALAEPKPCGECSMCCKLLLVEDLQKPPGVWCPKFRKGIGCSIHATRPQICRGYQCLWTYAAPLDDSWRPDRCRFIMTTGVDDELVIETDTGFPDAWKKEPFYSQIKAWSQRRTTPHRTVMVRTRGRMIVVFPEADIDLGPERPGAALNSGYEQKDGVLAPYARWAEAS